MMKKNITFLFLLLSFFAFAQVPSNGLVAYYPFTGNAYDMSGHGYDGIVNGPTLTTDRFGNSNCAYSFNGVSNYIELSTYVSNLNFQYPATFSFWVKTQFDFSQVLFSLNDGLNGAYGEIIAVGNNSTGSLTDELITQSYEQAGGEHYIAGYTTSNRGMLINTGWHNVVFVFDGVFTVLYLDTVQLSLTTNWGTNNGHFGNLGTAVMCDLGVRYSNGYGGFLNGCMDDVRIYNRVLTYSEICSVFHDSSTATANSVAANSATVSPQSLCQGSSATLSVSGGSLGTSASWHWYSGTCGGTFAGSGTTVVISPSASSTYFARAEGQTNTTSCVSAYVTVNSLSVPVTAANSSSPVCAGTVTTLSKTGGSLGSGAFWYWYAGACGTNFVGVNSTILDMPAATTTYYIRAEGSCNTTACASTEVIVNNPPSAHLSCSSNRNNYCSNAGGVIILSASGGTGAKTAWYTGSCGGVPAGTGNPLTLSAPTGSLRYWVRTESDGCTPSACISLAITVYAAAWPPASVSSSAYSLCGGSGGTITLTASGGSGSSFTWFAGSCGANTVGTGKSLTINSPGIAITYYGRYESLACGGSSCRTLTILSASAAPSQPDSIVGNIHPASGTTEIYSVTNDPSNIYTWTVPSGWTGSGSSSSVAFIVGVSGCITVVPSNGCGTGPARTLDIVTGFRISGHFIYDNVYLTPLDSLQLSLFQGGILKGTTMTDTNGFYSFSGLMNGSYNISATTHKPINGINATDAVKVKRHFSGSDILNNSILLHAADVNMSFSINVTDAVKITRRFVGSDTSFVRGDWVFGKPSGGDTVNVSVYANDTVTVNGASVVQDFYGLCTGDINCSNIPSPGMKNGHSLRLLYNGINDTWPGGEFAVPVISGSALNISAISVDFVLPDKDINIISVQPLIINHEELNLISSTITEYRQNGRNLKIAWVEGSAPVKINAGDTLFIIKGKTGNDVRDGDYIKLLVADDPDNEFADENTNTIDYVSLEVPVIKIHEHVSPGATSAFDISSDIEGNTIVINVSATGQPYSIDICNYLGQIIYSRAEKNGNTFRYKCAGSGTYFIILRAGSNVKVKKIVVSGE